MTDYERELNPNQLQAVTYCDGPSLVIAGAGSGKTRVLTYKISYLLEHGFQPWNILALTFTNKAAREMKERITRQVGPALAQGLWMGTFHSIFARILRVEAMQLGFSSNFTIYDSADQKSLLKSIIKEMGLDDKTYKPATVAAHISTAKNQLILPDAYPQHSTLMENDKAAHISRTFEIYKEYSRRCKQADAMDFDDLLVYTAWLFQQHPDIRQKYAQRFGYILVDEYQDTNYAQHTIVWQLAQDHQRLCVVGDDAQSIYSFRGARIDNILHFSDRYKGAQVFKLVENYRSTQTIVQAANSLINKNKRQIHKEVYSRLQQGGRIPVIQATSDIEEALIVAGRIRNLHKREGVPYREMAILYRTNAQSRSFEDTLRREGIPYRIYGGLSFYQRKEIKDVIAYFRLVLNPNDEEAFKRIINTPARGIGDTTVGKITACARTEGVSLWSVISNPEACGLPVNKGTLNKLNGFRQLIAGWREQLDEADAYQLGGAIIMESGIWADLHAHNGPEDIARQENVDELINTLHGFVQSRLEEGSNEVGMREFLAEVALLTDMDSDDDSPEKVTLMTVHAAKGLEYQAVFVVGMERDLFPSMMSSNSLSELEEERRLFYVALTRAKEYCVLTHAKTRFRYGQTEMCNPSPFLKDIDPMFLDQMDSMGNSRNPMSSFGFQQPAAKPVRPTAPVHITPKWKPVQKSAEPKPQQSVTTSAGTLQVGQVIEHERFGIGDVVAVTGQGENAKATVKFRHAGEKQLLLKYARFTIIE